MRAPFLSAGRILETTDMVSVLPRRIAQDLMRHRPLAIRPLLVSSPAIETSLPGLSIGQHLPGLAQVIRDALDAGDHEGSPSVSHYDVLVQKHT